LSQLSMPMFNIKKRKNEKERKRDRGERQREKRGRKREKRVLDEPAEQSVTSKLDSQIAKPEMIRAVSSPPPPPPRTNEGDASGPPAVIRAGTGPPKPPIAEANEIPIEEPTRARSPPPSLIRMVSGSPGKELSRRVRSDVDECTPETLDIAKILEAVFF